MDDPGHECRRAVLTGDRSAAVALQECPAGVRPEPIYLRLFPNVCIVAIQASQVPARPLYRPVVRQPAEVQHLRGVLGRASRAHWWCADTPCMALQQKMRTNNDCSRQLLSWCYFIRIRILRNGPHMHHLQFLGAVWRPAMATEQRTMLKNAATPHNLY